jgi:hypothetical protein
MSMNVELSSSGLILPDSSHHAEKKVNFGKSRGFSELAKGRDGQ